MKFRLLLALLCFASSCGEVYADTATATSTATATAASATPISTWSFVESTVTFHGRAALVSVDGEKSTVQGSLVQAGAVVTGELSVDLKPLRTGNELRDNHMHQKYLETGKYGYATLSIKEIPAVTGAETKWCGKLKVKADTQEVCGTYTLDQAGELKAEFELSLDKIPTLMDKAKAEAKTKAEKVAVEWAGAILSDTVKVKLTAKVKRS